MTFDEMSAMARESRERYRELERRSSGREWDVHDLFTGFVGDVGDLAQLLGAVRGVRPGPDDLSSAVAHELADCLWSLLVLADSLDVDLEAAFADLHVVLVEKVAARLAALGAD